LLCTQVLFFIVFSDVFSQNARYYPASDASLSLEMPDQQPENISDF
jgi:hypothetical protein